MDARHMSWRQVSLRVHRVYWAMRSAALLHGPNKRGKWTGPHSGDQGFDVNACDWPQSESAASVVTNGQMAPMRGKKAGSCFGPSQRVEDGGVSAVVRQRDDVRARRRCRALAVGRAAVRPWHQVMLRTVALDAAVAKAGKRHRRNVAAHILRWHLVTIGHAQTESENTIGLRTSATPFHSTVSVAAGWSHVCAIHSCQKNASHLVATLNKWGRKCEKTEHYHPPLCKAT